MNPKIGRNDYCPCKSGLKFKKCCIDKPLNLFPQHTPERRNQWWSFKEISQIPTDKIIEKLVMCGIPFSMDEFLIDVHNHYGSGDIYKKWKNRYSITTTGFDGDFPWMAADVLWRRLAPEMISTEMLDDWMQEGYDLIEKRDEVGGCTIWLKVWEELKKRFTPEIRTIEDTDKVFSGSQSLFNWCQDLEMELGNAAIEDGKMHLERIRYCGEFLDHFPDSEYFVQEMGKARAESLVMSGKVEEGEKAFQNLIVKYPKNPWFYIYWGDLYAGFGIGRGGRDSMESDPQKADELYRKALEIESDEVGIRDTIEERIRNLKVVEVLKQAKG